MTTLTAAKTAASSKNMPIFKSPLALTKLLATIGPASEPEAVLTRLIESGVTLFRVNFSHGTLEDAERRVNAIRAVVDRLGVPVAIMGDLSGPKIRVGLVQEPGITVDAGDEVEIHATSGISRADGDRVMLTCTYPHIAAEVETGHRVLINDGAIRMLAVDSNGGALICRVTTGGLITSNKGINLPDSDLSVPALTEKDWKCAEWAVRHRLDFLALSFVRTARDVIQLRDRLAHLCTPERMGMDTGIDDAAYVIPVIAKIETPQAVANIDSILQHSDAIMVARGDLGVEIDLARVPVIQKRLVQAAHDFGKPCIVATQMLESMISQPHPTRAEVSDVANAILDGADCVMLSGETAVGKYPVLAADTVRRVALATEEELRLHPQSERPPARLREARERVAALAHGAWHIARDVDAKIVVVWSQNGSTARHLSRNNFQVPVVAFTTDPSATRRMNLLYGVVPMLVDSIPSHRSDFAEMADRTVLQAGLVQRGDPIVLLGGKPLGQPGTTNTVALRYAGELSPGRIAGDDNPENTL